MYFFPGAVSRLLQIFHTFPTHPNITKLAARALWNLLCEAQDHKPSPLKENDCEVGVSAGLRCISHQLQALSHEEVDFEECSEVLGVLWLMLLLVEEQAHKVSSILTYRIDTHPYTI